MTWLVKTTPRQPKRALRSRSGGLFAGLPEADVKAQLRRHLLALGKAAPGGKDHLLVKRAQKAYERKFGQFEWPEEGLVTAQHMADADSDERGHVHGPGCGHTHQ